MTAEYVNDPGQNGEGVRALQDLIQTFLAALSDPEGGDALYRLHAADAPLRHKEGVDLAARIDPGAFAAAHRAANLHGSDRLPRFAYPRIIEAARGKDSPGDTPAAVTWFTLTEQGGARSLIAALGTRRIADEFRIGWCTLATRVEPWSYRQGLLQSLADYPWMRRSEPAVARALLDASYFRRFWRPEATFTSLPGARFSCQMSADCCRHDYEITLPSEAQLLLDAMPWERVNPQLAGTQLPVRPDGKLQLKSAEESCRFLAPSGRCVIHQVLGRQPFAACCVFPFSFARTPEGISVGISPLCGSVRLGQGIPIQGREEDLHERLVHSEPRATDLFRLAPDMAVSWEQFRDIERSLCDCLATADLPMRRRLYVGAKLLQALRNGQVIDSVTWMTEPYPPIVADLREAIRAMLVRILGWDRAALRALPRVPPLHLHAREVSDAPTVATILQNTLYCKVFSYPFDLTTAFNLLVVLYLVTLTMQAAQPGPLPTVLWRELGSLGVHGLLRSLIDETAPQDFRTLFATADFGLWMLAA